MEEGYWKKQRKVYPYRHLNSLNTVGYKELFKYFDGEWELPFAIEKIKQNSRIYSRKQMTWFKRDNRHQMVSSRPTRRNHAIHQEETVFENEHIKPRKNFLEKFKTASQNSFSSIRLQNERHDVLSASD